MATILNSLLFICVLGLHTLVAAVLTRFLRIRLRTQWGYLFYTTLVGTVTLFITTLIFSGVLNIGINLGDAVTAAIIMIALPLGLGVAIDILYVPPPEEYTLPDTE
jgi:hypothetical protein